MKKKIKQLDIIPKIKNFILSKTGLVKKNMKHLEIIYKIRDYIWDNISSMKKKTKHLGMVSKFRDSISLKIVSSVSILVVVGMIFIGMFIYIITYNTMFNMSKDNMKTVSTQIYNNFNTLIDGEKNDVKQISIDNDVNKVLVEISNSSDDSAENNYSGDMNILTNKLKKFAGLNKYDENIFVTNKKGFIIACSNDDFQRFDLSTHDYMQQTLLSGTAVMSNVYTSVVSIKPVVTFLQPIKDASGNIIGTVGKNVYTDYFSNTFDKFKFLSSGYIFIVDDSQSVIYSPDKMNINKKDNLKAIDELSKDSRFMNFGNSNIIKYTKDNIRYYADCTSVPKLKALIVLTVKQSEIESAPKIIGMSILGIGVVLIILIIIILNLIIKRIFKPMNILIKNTKEISRGNLTVTNPIYNMDEIGTLSFNFNNMTYSLKNLLSEIKGFSDDFLRINVGIKHSYSSIVIGMKSVDENTEIIEQDTLKIFNAVESSFNSFDTVKDKSENIKLQSEKVLKEAVFIKDINNEGLKTVNELKNINLETNERLSEANSSFDKLKLNLMNIAQVGKTVTQISRQTHILSINAAIEAGRYGDIGKGFGVVASEIKKLSKNVSYQMEKIDEILLALNSDMSNVQEKIGEVNTSTNHQFKIVNNTIDNYAKMLSSSEAIVNYMNEAYKSIGMLNEENYSVSERLTKIKNSYEEFNNTIVAVSKIASEKYENTKDMYDMLEYMHTNSEKMADSINKFTV